MHTNDFDGMGDPFIENDPNCPAIPVVNASQKSSVDIRNADVGSGKSLQLFKTSRHCRDLDGSLAASDARE